MLLVRYKAGLQTRERILAATRELLGELGMDATTVSGICAKAGIGAGSFYNLFDTKEQAEVFTDGYVQNRPKSC